MNIRGWVYVISNISMPGLLKVGFSTKDPQLRAEELGNTGSPQPYLVEYDALVHSPRDLEQQIHHALQDRCAGKEWFKCPLEEAIAAVRSITETERIAESYRDNALPDLTNAKPSQPLSSLPHIRNSSARWHWSARTQQLTKKDGNCSFAPEQYSYEGQGPIRGFATWDKETPWIAIEDVEILE